MRDEIISDTIEFKGVQFVVRVENLDMYINADTDKVRSVNARGNPSGLKSNSRKWVVCDCIVASLRPEYGHTHGADWLDEVEHHHTTAEPLEVPERKYLFFYGTKDRDRKRDNEELIEDVINKLKDAYEDRPSRLDSEDVDLDVEDILRE